MVTKQWPFRYALWQGQRLQERFTCCEYYFTSKFNKNCFKIIYWSISLRRCWLLFMLGPPIMHLPYVIFIYIIMNTFFLTKSSPPFHYSNLTRSLSTPVELLITGTKLWFDINDAGTEALSTPNGRKGWSVTECGWVSDGQCDEKFFSMGIGLQIMKKMFINLFKKCF